MGLERTCEYCHKKFNLKKIFRVRRFCNKICAAKWRYIHFKSSRDAMLLGLKIAHLNVAERSKKFLTRRPHPQWIGKNNPNYGKNARRGNKHPQWIKDRSKLKSRPLTEGRKWRIKIFKRDNYTCQKCGSRNGNGKRIVLNAHHIKPYAKYPKLRFNINNGITLCNKCHKYTDNFAINKKYQHL